MLLFFTLFAIVYSQQCDMYYDICEQYAVIRFDEYNNYSPQKKQISNKLLIQLLYNLMNCQVSSTEKNNYDFNSTLGNITSNGKYFTKSFNYMIQEHYLCDNSQKSIKISKVHIINITTMKDRIIVNANFYFNKVDQEYILYSYTLGNEIEYSFDNYGLPIIYSQTTHNLGAYKSDKIEKI